MSARTLVPGRRLLEVSTQEMGHHSTRITVDIWGHLVPGANNAAVDRLDDTSGRPLYATPALTR